MTRQCPGVRDLQKPVLSSITQGSTRPRPVRRRPGFQAVGHHGDRARSFMVPTIRLPRSWPRVGVLLCEQEVPEPQGTASRRIGAGSGGGPVCQVTTKQSHIVRMASPACSSCSSGGPLLQGQLSWGLGHRSISINAQRRSAAGRSPARLLRLYRGPVSAGRCIA